jgi:hypothetical protein
VSRFQSKIDAKRAELEFRFNQSVRDMIQNRYNLYPRAPFDTGETWATTKLAFIHIDFQNYGVKIEANTTEYYKYFADPQNESNPNYKYGPRNAIKDTINLPEINKIIKELTGLIIMYSVENDMNNIGKVKLKAKL